MAGARRDAQRQRLDDEGGHPVQLDLERGLRGRLRARTASAQWLERGRIDHDMSHARPIDDATFAGARDADRARGFELGEALRRDQAILGVFDEGCMGMYNAIVPDELMHAMGLFKERLSQSMLYAAMREVPDETARRHYEWLRAPRHEVRARRRRGERADRVAGARGPEDVRRGRAHGPRFRLRRRSASSTSRA